MMPFSEFLSKKKEELETAIKEIDRDILNPIIKDIFGNEENITIERRPSREDYKEFDDFVSWYHANVSVTYVFKGKYDYEGKCEQFRNALIEAFKDCARLRPDDSWFRKGIYKDKVKVMIGCNVYGNEEYDNFHICVDVYVQTK